MSTDNVVSFLVIEPKGHAYSEPDGCAYGAILEIEQATGVNRAQANRATITSGGAYDSNEAELSVTSMIKNEQPDLILLIAFGPNDGAGRLTKNAKRLREFVPFGAEEDPTWPRQVRAFYIDENGIDGPLTWREVLIEEAV